MMGKGVLNERQGVKMDRKAIKGNFDSNADERQTDALWALYEAAERAVNECVDLYSVLQKNRKSVGSVDTWRFQR